ncbi:MAG: DUF1330 domain-containing protein [Gammaproteobacteria bacterium]|nr:DUF1330 domain-containing protein [Gammaproteobacteria bacterium]
MPAYLIARVEISDPERYSSYTAVSPGVVEKFGGRFIVRGGDVVTLEGSESSVRWIVVEFSSVETARKFYDSPDYTAARALRAGAADAEFVVLEGYVPV